MSKIVSIDPDHEWEATKWDMYSGVCITLDDGKQVKFGIAEGQSCCEYYGYLHPADDYNEYIGAEYLGVREINTWPANVDVPDRLKGLSYSGYFQAIEVATSNGPLQFVVYNDHNGYYPHAVILVENGTSEIDYL